jgi:ClpP class serine protease
MNFLIHNPQMNLRKMQAGAVPTEPPERVQSSVGVIPVVGVLAQRPDWFESGSTYAGICAALERFEAEPAIAAIVLDVDSCGGSADGVFETAEKIRACKKPVVAYGRGLVASSAYLLFSAAHYRVAHRSALVGSVGAYECYYVGDGVNDIKYIVSTQSPNKVPDPTQPEGEKIIQARVDSLAEMFIGDLAKYFNTTPEKVKADFGGGEVILAEQAQLVGMVDEVGNFKAALAATQKTQITIDSMSNAPQRTQQMGVVQKRANGGRTMARKMALTITDDANVTEGAETFEVTPEVIRDKFPEVYKAIQDTAVEEMKAEAAEVEETAATADTENPEEMQAVAQARAGKMSANDLRKTLLTAKAKYAGSDEAKKRAMAAMRGKDQPPVVNASAAQFGVKTQKDNVFARIGVV